MTHSKKILGLYLLIFLINFNSSALGQGQNFTLGWYDPIYLASDTDTFASFDGPTNVAANFI